MRQAPRHERQHPTAAGRGGGRGRGDRGSSLARRPRPPRPRAAGAPGPGAARGPRVDRRKRRRHRDPRGGVRPGRGPAAGPGARLDVLAGAVAPPDRGACRRGADHRLRPSRARAQRPGRRRGLLDRALRRRPRRRSRRPPRRRRAGGPGGPLDGRDDDRRLGARPPQVGRRALRRGRDDRHRPGRPDQREPRGERPGAARRHEGADRGRAALHRGPLRRRPRAGRPSRRPLRGVRPRRPRRGRRPWSRGWSAPARAGSAGGAAARSRGWRSTTGSRTWTSRRR